MKEKLENLNDLHQDCNVTNEISGTLFIKRNNSVQKKKRKGKNKDGISFNDDKKVSFVKQIIDRVNLVGKLEKENIISKWKPKVICIEIMKIFRILLNTVSIKITQLIFI